MPFFVALASARLFLCSGDFTSPFCIVGFHVYPEARRAGAFLPLFDFRISNFWLLQTLRSVAKKTIQEEGYDPEVADLSIRR